MAEADVDPQISLKSLKLDNLPRVLNFDDSRDPALVETAKRIIATAKQNPKKAAAVADTYEQLAEDKLEDQLDESRRNAPGPQRERELTKARAGLLVNLARIWRDAGVVGKCRETLDRAIDLARYNRWPSIVSFLENERRKLLTSQGR